MIPTSHLDMRRRSASSVLRSYPIYGEASIISIHTPMAESTAGLVDKDFVDALNRDTILVNTSRGGVVKDTDVIAYGLAIGQLSFVALDVLPQEPPEL